MIVARLLKDRSKMSSQQNSLLSSLMWGMNILLEQESHPHYFLLVSLLLSFTVIESGGHSEKNGKCDGIVFSKSVSVTEKENKVMAKVIHACECS